MWAGLPKRSQGGLFFSPVRDENHLGHYKTYLQHVTMQRSGKLEPIVPDSCFEDLEFGRCKEADCMYVFRSQVDKARHLLLIHKAAKSNAFPDGFTCRFQIPGGNTCKHKEVTRYKLNKHKIAVGHKVSRKGKEHVEEVIDGGNPGEGDEGADRPVEQNDNMDSGDGTSRASGHQSEREDNIDEES